MAKRERRNPKYFNLDYQIQVMEASKKVMRNPLVDAILSSLKELDGIKKNRVEKLKRENGYNHNL